MSEKGRNQKVFECLEWSEAGSSVRHVKPRRTRASQAACDEVADLLRQVSAEVILPRFQRLETCDPGDTAWPNGQSYHVRSEGSGLILDRTPQILDTLLNTIAL